MIRAAAMAAVVIALAGCNEDQSFAPSEGDARHVSTFHDHKNGVTCWLYGPSNGGISCLPDWMLTPAESQASGVCGFGANGYPLPCDGPARGAK